MKAAKERFFSTSTLKTRLAIVFAATVLVIGIIYSGCVMFAIIQTETQLMSSTLESMLNEAVDDMARGEPARLDSFSQIYIEGDPIREIPERYAELPNGYSEYTADEELHIFAKEYNGQRYVLTRTQDEFEEWERQLFIRGLVLLLILANVALFIGFLASRLFFRPLDRLMMETRRMNRDLASGQVNNDYFRGQWERNEIGELARTFQMTTSRMQNLLIGERQFVSSVSHELRTPLTVILTSLELLESSENLQTYERNVLARAKRTTMRMSDLLSVFLSIVRENNSPQNMREGTLEEIFNECIPAWQQSAQEKGLRLEAVKKSADFTIKYNVVLVASILTNLVENAIRYTDRGFVRVVLDKDYVSVFDTGAGISLQEKERIFDQGYRGKSSDGKVGYGLGLSIVTRACSRLGWHIDLYDEESVGTTFTVTFN